MLKPLTARHNGSRALADYHNTFHKLQNFLDADPLIDQIDRATLQRFFAAQDVSNKTLLNYHTGLSALWTWAVSERLAPENPLHGIQRPKPEKRDIVPLTEQDVRALLNAVDHSKTYHRPGKRPTTQLFFPGQAENQTDQIFNPDLVLPVQSTSTGLVASFDFIVSGQ